MSDILKNQQREELTSSAQVDLKLSNLKKIETKLIYFFYLCQDGITFISIQTNT